MPLPVSLRALVRCSVVLLALLAVPMVSACGASSSDNSGTLAGAQSTTTSRAAQSSTATVAPGACSTPGSGRTDDFKQVVTLQPPTADGLKIGDIVVGTGALPQSGHKVSVEYTGWLSDGTQFDSSRKAGGSPFSFTLGAGDVIKGWDEGVATMRVGGVRRLVIPPALGYGASGYPPTIPANATLTFDVELLSAC